MSLDRMLLVGAVGLGFVLGAAPADEAMEPTAEQEYMRVADAMSAAMAEPMSGDPDEDFAAMMIAHHKGAVQMAIVELQYGTDPRMRHTAEQIIKAQTREVEELERWLKDRKP